MLGHFWEAASEHQGKPVGCGSPEIGFSPTCDLLASPWLGMDVAGMRVLLGSSIAGPFDDWGTERPSCGSPWEPRWATEIELLLPGEVVGASSL